MKYIIYLNILLLIKFTSGAEEPFVSSSISPIEQTEAPITEDFPAEISSTVEDTLTSTIPPDDVRKNETVAETINTSNNSNEDKNIDDAVDVKADSIDSVPSTNEDEPAISDTDPLPKLPEEELKEMEDMQFGGNFQNIPKTINEDDEVILPYPIENDIINPTVIVEWIQEDEQEPENDIDAHPVAHAMTDNSGDKMQEYFLQGQIGIILASMLIVFLVSVYIVFIAWRRFIVRRYGNREILINEEDMIDPSDMKHFSL